MADLTSLANVKQWLNLTVGTDDALLTRLIGAASDYIQTWLNRTLASAAYTENRDGPGGTRLMFANYPVTIVTSVSIDGTVIPPSTGPLVPGWVANSTSVQLRGSYRFSDGIQNCVVAYTAGYATTPAEVEQACIELVARRYKKDRVAIGVSSKQLAGETITFSEKDFSDAIRETLIQYKKVISV